MFRAFRLFWLATSLFFSTALISSANAQTAAGSDADWFAFAPAQDSFAKECAIDLRFLNERMAGEQGFIGVKNGHFIHTANNEPLRFWAVNGPPHDLKEQELKDCARMLAKRGVNMVRIHGGYFNERGDIDTNRIAQAFNIVRAMKAEGIYSHFSIYFPLWLTPKADNPYLQGYNGKKHPFAALFFNPSFQEQYPKWWTALLTTPDPKTGKPLVQEPAVASLEMQNEDSLFFWTFSEENIPDAELKILEQMFGAWLTKRYTSLPSALAKWNQTTVKRDNIAEGRIGFRPLWSMFHDKTLRDQDTAEFLLEVQTDFYKSTYAFLRKLGFKGPITACNWITANPEVLGPLEKLSYSAGDFTDRHGYFSCDDKGEASEWSIRNGHTYADRSALRFDPEIPGKPKEFNHPAMDIHYDNKPSILSETTWNRPNRFRSEAPLYFACYGALQDSDAIVHFALDGTRWSVKPGYWMQPWTLMSPAMVGQFPATALIFRRGLIRAGEVLASVELSRDDLVHLKGTPLPQDASLDELRLKDIPSQPELKPGSRLDPLLHFAGRSEVRFSSGKSTVKTGNLKPLIDHAGKKITSSTGELKLDYDKGLLTIDAPQAQGVSGLLAKSGTIQTRDLVLQSAMDLGHIVLVSLDNQPLASSSRMLLQVMSEERATGFKTESVTNSLKRIVSIGTDPWSVRNLEGKITFKRADIAALSVTALDYNGYPTESAKLENGNTLALRKAVMYYLLSKNP